MPLRPPRLAGEWASQPACATAVGACCHARISALNTRRFRAEAWQTGCSTSKAAVAFIHLACVSAAGFALVSATQALAESGIAFEAKETSITAGSKPEWFTDVYRKSLGADLTSDGKVPVIVVKGAGADGGDFVLTESAVIVDYVANKYAPQLLPKTPEDRARAAIFTEQVIGKVRAGEGR